MTIARIEKGGQSRPSINAAIDVANDVLAAAGSFGSFALAFASHTQRLSVSERALALAVSRSELADERAQRIAGDQAALAAAKNLLLPAPVARPGDVPSAYTDQRSGRRPDDLPPLSDVPVGDSEGLVIRRTGAGVVMMRRLAAVERNRIYRARFAIRRRVDAADPSNDVVRCAILWLNSSLQPLGPAYGTVVTDLTGLRAAQGRREVSAMLARVSGPDITITAPPGARYARAYVEIFGGAQVTDIEVVELADVTDSVIWAPSVDGLSSRVGALESLDAGDRLDAIEAALDAPFTLTYQTRLAAAAATIPVFVNTIRVLGYAAPGDGGGALYKAGPEPTHQAWFEGADGRAWENAEDVLTPEMEGATGGSDDSAAFTRALSPARGLRCMDGRVYRIRNVLVPSGCEVDLNHCQIRPAAGADFAIGAIGPVNEFLIHGGNLSDPDNVTLRQTLLTAPIVAGGTSAAVLDASAFAVGDCIWIVADQVDGGAKSKIHHTGITAKAGNTLTLRDAMPAGWSASAGNYAMHTKGLIFIDGPVIYTLRDLAVTTAPMIGTLRGQNLGTTGSGSCEIANIRFDALSLGGWRIEHDVAQTSFTGIVGYGHPGLSWRPCFGLSFESAGETTGTSGDHYIDRVRVLAMQHGIAGRRWLYGFLQSFVADNCYGAGLDLDRGSDIYGSEVWVQYNALGISMRGNSRMLVSMLQSDIHAPWAGPWDIEIEDGSALYVNQAGWSGSKILRNTPGWSQSNLHMMTGSLWLEDGFAGAPGLGFRTDPTTGLRRVSAGRLSFVSAGADRVLFTETGLRNQFGSAATPSYGFNGADGTGAYAASATEIAFSAGGTKIGFFATPGLGVSGGTWNTPHLLLGAYHLWIDTFGRLRLKSGAPTSALDGTVVGAQS